MALAHKTKLCAFIALRNGIRTIKQNRNVFEVHIRSETTPKSGKTAPPLISSTAAILALNTADQ